MQDFADDLNREIADASREALFRLILKQQLRIHFLETKLEDLDRGLHMPYKYRLHTDNQLCVYYTNYMIMQLYN